MFAQRERLFVLSLLLFMVFGYGLIGLSTFFKSDYFKTKTLLFLNENVPGAYSWDKFSLNFFRGEFEVENVRHLIKSRYEFGAQRLYVKFRWSSLLMQEFRLKSVIVQRPWISLDIGADIGQSESGYLEHFDIKDYQGFDFDRFLSRIGLANIVVDSILILDGSLAINADQNWLNTSIENLNIVAGADMLKRQGAIELNSGQFRFRLGRFETLLDSVKVSGEYRIGNVQPFRLNINSKGLDFEIIGKVHNLLNSPSFDILINTKIETFVLAPIAPSFVFPEGVFSSEIALTGSFLQPVIKA